VLSLRQSLYLPLDDLLYITREYINAAVSRAGIARLLKREGMSRLEGIIPKAEGETLSPKKTFKDYEPGFVHIDIKYLPQMPDETSRRYLFVAIDRATRWAFLHIYGDMTDKSSVDSVRRLKIASPIKITKILTDNGSQFTDRFSMKDKAPSGQHAFDKVCAGIGHRAPSGAATSPANERHGGTLQQPHQRAVKADQVRQPGRSRNYLAQLLEAIQPPHSAARHWLQNANSSA
jgi:hypothetical protein